MWADTDVKNWHPRMVYGTLGPLLHEPRLQYVKGYYQRPIVEDGVLKEGGGGRVTELVARPLINLFYPELSGMIQPLAGEYAGRRALLEAIPFFTGYAVEIGHLIDAAERLGIEGLGQVDLERRVHRNQELEGLSRMSFVILQAVMKRLEERRKARLFAEMGSTMKLPRSGRGRLSLEVIELADQERPPMIRIPEYLERHRPEGVPEEIVGPRRGRAGRAARPADAGVADTPLTILIAPDSFKGSLTSVQVARALADGWSRARPDDTILLCPLADGGEGTLEAVAAAGGWEWQETDRRPTRSGGRSRRAGSARRTASRGRHRDGRGVRPVAGRARRARRRRARRRRGTGDVLRAVADVGRPRGHRSGIGGSATTDGGSGMLEALSMDYAPRADAAMARGIPETLDRCRPARSRRGPVERPDVGRLRRVEPAARADRRGRDLRAAEGRDPGPGRRPRRPPRALGRTASRPRIGPPTQSATRRAPARPAASGSRCSRSRTAFAGVRPAARASTWSWRRPTSTPGSPAPTSSSPARAGSTPRPGSARPLSASPGGPQAAGVPCIAVGGGVEPDGIEALAAVGAIAVPVIGAPDDGRGGDGRRRRARRAVRRAARPPGRVGHAVLRTWAWWRR